MQFAERFIRRPVLSSMVSLGIVLVGIIGYRQLPVREFPDADPPIVSVTAILPGANPQVVESSVTDVLEEELSSLEGLRSITSASQEQVSTITLEFTLDREIEAAAQDVRDKVSRVRGRLPEDVEEPVIAKQEADAFPIMFLSLTSKTYDLMELSDLADRQIKPRLQTIGGVSSAPIYGERRFAIRVWLSPAELAKLSDRIDAMPAGQSAVGVVVGALLIIFLVLLITDLLGLGRKEHRVDEIT